MSRDHLVTMRLADDLLASLRDAARAESCAPADLIRRALRGALAGRSRQRGHSVADLRQAAMDACGWADMQARLRAMGFMLRADITGVEFRLHSWPVDRPLMTAAAAGLDVTDLTLRFGCGFPGFAGVGFGRPGAGSVGSVHGQTTGTTARNRAHNADRDMPGAVAPPDRVWPGAADALRKAGEAAVRRAA